MNSHTVFQMNTITKLAKYMDENFLLKNKRANFNQTLHNAFLDKEYSSLFKLKAMPFSKARQLQNSKQKTFFFLEI